jgi:hypothetical protein
MHKLELRFNRLQVDVDGGGVDLQTALEESLHSEEVERHGDEVTTDLIKLLLDVLDGHIDPRDVTGLDGSLRDPLGVLLPSLDVGGGDDVEDVVEDGGVLVGGSLPEAFGLLAERILLERASQWTLAEPSLPRSSLTVTSLSSSEAVSSM